MSQNRRQSPSDETGAEPGADRFWGEFSRAGSRGSAGEPARDASGTDPGDSGQSTDGAEERQEHRHAHGDGECLEWCPICRAAELFRNTVTPEIREQAEALQREALHIFQAFLAAYAERTSGPASGRPGPNTRADGSGGAPAPDREPETEVTDIPLD